MRIVCLVSDGPGGYALANSVHVELGVDLAIIAKPRGARNAVARKYRSAGFQGVRDAARERLTARSHAGRHRRDLDHWLGDRWRALSEEIPRLHTQSVNDPSVTDRVVDLGEVLLLVHTDVLLGPQLLGACRTSLNLHWGLSPYYRGTRCTEWALLHWDPHNIGVTVHHLTAEIDGGAIVGQARAEIRPGDTVHSINTQLTSLGTEIAVRAARIIQSGAELGGTPQDLTRGYLTYKRQWSGHLQRHVARLERAGLRPLLEAPARDPLPIVELG